MIDSDKKLIEELKRNSLFYSSLEWRAAVRLRELIDSGDSYYKRAVELQEENYSLKTSIEAALECLECGERDDAFYILLKANEE